MAKQKFDWVEVGQIIDGALGSVTEDFTPTYESVSTLLDKIGLTISLQGDIIDHLEMFDDVRLPLGTTVEEYVHDLLTVKDYDRNSTPYGQDEIDTRRAYHTRSGDKKIELPVWEDEIKRAFTSNESMGSFVARMLKRITDTYNEYKFTAKKKALGEKLVRDHDVAVGWKGTVDEDKDYTEKVGYKSFLNIVTGEGEDKRYDIHDKASSEEFILAVQSIVEDMGFTSRKYNPFGIATQTQPKDLVLLLKKGALPIMNVRSLANVFNKELLGLGIQVKVIDDFGVTVDEENIVTKIADKVYAVLTDKNLIKYMTTREVTKVDINGNALRTLYTKHFGETVVVSDAVPYVAFTNEHEV